MTNAPVILSYFAQSDDQQRLAMLDREQTGIKAAWATGNGQLTSTLHVDYLPRTNEMASLEQFQQDLNTYGERIVLFHFSGHSGQDAMWFNDTTGAPDGVAGLLAVKAPNLKLVILNGCSNSTQVATYFGRGIRVLIATHCAINDNHAAEFGVTFHQTLARGKSISEAYREAILDVQSNGALNKLLPPGVSELPVQVRGGMLNTMPSADKVWGLFNLTTGATILNDSNWLALSYIQKKELINPEKAYIYERRRANYLATFSTSFDPAQNASRSRVQHYLLAGDQSESPLGLIRKLCYESIMQFIDRRFYFYSFSDLFDGNKVVGLSRVDVTAVHVLRKLVLAVTGPPQLLERSISLFDTRSATDLCQDFFDQNSFKGRQFALIAFCIDSDELTETSTRAIIDAINHLNEWTSKLTTGPYFLFFWTVQQERSFFNWLSARPLRKTIDRFNTLVQGPLSPRIFVLNDDYKFLERPDREDIDHWMNHYYQPPASQKPDDDVLDALYREANVENLEHELLRLIHDVNTQPA